jgi:hypothetical protein
VLRLAALVKAGAPPAALDAPDEVRRMWERRAAVLAPWRDTPPSRLKDASEAATVLAVADAIAERPTRSRRDVLGAAAARVRVWARSGVSGAESASARSLARRTGGLLRGRGRRRHSLDPVSVRVLYAVVRWVRKHDPLAFPEWQGLSSRRITADLLAVAESVIRPMIQQPRRKAARR